MILVIGASGFIGSALVRHLLEAGKKVRVLVRSSSPNFHIPPGKSVDIVVGELSDQRKLDIALDGVRVIYHLIGGEWKGVRADLSEIEIQNIQHVIRSAKDAPVDRIFYLSHFGANRASAYTVLKVKGIVEELIKRSGINFTIVRTGLVFGPNDNFTVGLAKLISLAPYYVPLPGDGNQMIQPIWIEDLATCLTWALEMDDLIDQTISIGGPEFLSIKDVFELVMETAGLKKRFFYLQASMIRVAAIFGEYFIPKLPHSIYWLDYLASSRTSEFDSVSRIFGLLPARFSHHLDHLKGINWRREVLKDLSKQGGK